MDPRLSSSSSSLYARPPALAGVCGTRSLPGTGGPAASHTVCLCGKRPQPGPGRVYTSIYLRLTGQASHAIRRAARCFAAREKARLPVLRRGLPFSRQTAPEGLWVGRCLSKHSLSHHQLCLAVGVFLQSGKLSPWLPPHPHQKRALDSRGSRLRALS